MEVDGRFTLVDSRTNSPKKHQLALSSSTGFLKVETKFILVPDSLVELSIKFDGYEEKDHDNWPLAPVAR